MPEDKTAHNIYDRIFRENANHIFIALIQHFYQLDVKSFQVIDPKFPSTSDNEVDHLYRIIPNIGYEHIVHVEFQATNDPEMLARMQEYHAKIYKKFKLPVKPLVINLGDRPFTVASKLKDPEIFRGYDIIDLFSLSTEMLLNLQMPGAVILAILGNYEKEQLETVLGAIVEKLRKLVTTEKEMTRFVNQLFYLSRLRKFEKETKEKLEEMLIEIDIKNDFYYQQGNREGKAEGRVEGKEEGRAEGKEIGIDLGAQIIILYNKGESAEAIAKKLGISVLQVQSIIKRYSED